MTSCNLPGKRSRYGLRALDADLVLADVEGVQRGAEKPNRERNDKLEGEKGIIRKRAASCIVPRKCPRDRSRTLGTKLVQADVEGGQGGADQTVKKRAEEGKWGS